MRAAWQLVDGTRVDAKVVEIGKWSVRVNDVEVPSVSTKHSFFDNDTTFAIAPGREACLKMRKALHGAEIDLHVDGKVLLYPGSRPFRCPACRTLVQSYETQCSKCNTALPERAQRIQQRRYKLLLWPLLAPVVLLSVLTTVSAVSTLRDPRAAMAKLATTHADASEAELREQSSAWVWDNLSGMGIVLGVAVVLALLSRKAPLAAAALNLAMWLGLICINAFERQTFSFYFMFLYVYLIWNAQRGLRQAVEIRRAERTLFKSPSASR